ncbi:MAG: hypothetical protein ACT6TH_14440 [Brevundimonas sp.]|uniref:hypothetical protein n=1 Tax=Brevundimonas sp. TaxID=1871086 RepID=UPI0040344302
MDGRPIICLDFDGVIHRYDTPWTDAATISDGVTAGFFEWADEAAKHFRLVIYSSRSKEPKAVEAMMLWLVDQRRRWREAGGVSPNDGGVVDLEFAHEKPPAFLTIDDRAIQFTGDWSALSHEALLAFKPWNKRQ